MTSGPGGLLVGVAPDPPRTCAGRSADRHRLAWEPRTGGNGVTSWESEAESIKRERREAAEAATRAEEFERRRQEAREQQLLDFDRVIADFVSAAAEVNNPGIRGRWTRWGWLFVHEVSLEVRDILVVYKSGKWCLTQRRTYGDTNNLRVENEVLMEKNGKQIRTPEKNYEYQLPSRTNWIRRALTEFMIDHDIPLPS